jgi:antitoxin ParD1/3/4
MTAQRVTVSLPPEILEEAQAAVAGGAAKSLSAFVADALESKLSRARALAILERALGGRPPQEVIDAVRRDLGLPSVPAT